MGRTVRNLYELFRDGVIDEAIQLGSLDQVGPWKFLPQENLEGKERANVGRLQTMALVRRFMQRAHREFPAGIILTSKGLAITEEFVVFVKTHREMGSSHADMVAAWKAMASVMNT